MASSDSKASPCTKAHRQIGKNAEKRGNGDPMPEVCTKRENLAPENSTFRRKKQEKGEEKVAWWKSARATPRGATPVLSRLSQAP